MDRLEALQVFARVVEAGSFTAVARELGVGQPAVSKTIAALERALGVMLLRRTSRSLAITAAGQALFDEARPLLVELDDAIRRVGRGDRARSGNVRVAVAPGFGRIYVVPAARALRTRYPEISLEVAVSERHVDLVSENIDLAIRAGDMRDGSALAQRIGQVSLLTVASSAYLERHGEPDAPRDLARHDAIVFVSRGSRRAWRFRDASAVHPARPSFFSSNGEEIRAAVLADLGIAQLPAWLVAQDLAMGTIRPLMRSHEPEPLRLWLVRPGRRSPARVRVVADFLLRELGRVPILGAPRAVPLSREPR
jgi:LysR family transcriptional regulator for bpeEF and oprC